MTFDEIKELENIVIVEDTDTYLHIDAEVGYTMKHNGVYSKCFFIPKSTDETSTLEVVEDKDVVISIPKKVELEDQPDIDL